VFLQRLVLVVKGVFYFVLFYGNRFWCIALASHHLEAFGGWLVFVMAYPAWKSSFIADRLAQIMVLGT
jgi:hypothetical protein